MNCVGEGDNAVATEFMHSAETLKDTPDGNVVTLVPVDNPLSKLKASFLTVSFLL